MQKSRFPREPANLTRQLSRQCAYGIIHSNAPLKTAAAYTFQWPITSLRWYDPDQVQRVRNLARFHLSPALQAPPVTVILYSHEADITDIPPSLPDYFKFMALATLLGSLYQGDVLHQITLLASTVFILVTEA